MERVFLGEWKGSDLVKGLRWSIVSVFVAEEKVVCDGKKEEENDKESKAGFWPTVLKVEVMDIVFAVDSMLAAIAFAVSLDKLGWFQIGGLDVGHFGVIMIGGLLGIVAIRFAATGLLKIMDERPNLENAAYGLVTLVGVKLIIFTLAHEGFHETTGITFVTESFTHSGLMEGIYWALIIAIVLAGWFTGTKKEEVNKKKTVSKGA